MTDDSDRRGTERVSLMDAVTIDHGTGAFEASCINLSSSGISVWAPYAAPAGALVLTLTLGGQRHTLHGRIAREFVSDGGAVWGIEFFGVDARTQEILTRFVQESSAA